MARDSIVLRLEADIVKKGVWVDCCMLSAGVMVVLTEHNRPDKIIGRVVLCSRCQERT